MTCSNGGLNYSEGALICSNGHELRCSGGSWQETGYSCYVTDDEGSYTRISADGLYSSDSSISPDSIKHPKDPALLGCCVTIRGAPSGYARIYNNCGNCKVVTTQGGHDDIIRTRVPPHSSVDVVASGGSLYIIGEDDC
ncbi:hypothetical protein [Citrobacter portucalensis]|uniref:hypothetical protein n=1 Tax=Citrobacter portucalensis TaxID=1639133 RepID=UPI003BF50396